MPPALTLRHEGEGNLEGGACRLKPGTGGLAPQNPRNSGPIPSRPPETNSTKDSTR
jgi:hypothetical protein